MSPDGGIGRRAGLKILLAVKSVSVRPRFWAHLKLDFYRAFLFWIALQTPPNKKKPPMAEASSFFCSLSICNGGKLQITFNHLIKSIKETKYNVKTMKTKSLILLTN